MTVYHTHCEFVIYITEKSHVKRNFRLMFATNPIAVQFSALSQYFDLFISWYGLTNQAARSPFSFKSRNSISCITSLVGTVLVHLDFITARPISHLG